MKQAQIGVVGLGVMGANVARNFANHKIITAVYNRTTEVTEEFNKEFGNDCLLATSSLQDFVNSLESPRKILLMVTAGPAVDAVIAELIPLLAKDDIIIDGGNSLFSDTQKRTAMLVEKNLRYLGMGISGGEEGALNGPSMMAGVPEFAIPNSQFGMVKELFEKIAAKDFAGGSCLGWFTGPGSGHYVKMIHNGIEYAVMQLIAETYQFLRKGQGLSADEIGEIFAQWQKGKMSSYLIDITAQVLVKKDENGTNLVDNIKDKAGQKGTGQWTVQDAFQRGMPIPSIATAVEARQVSSFFETRNALARQYNWLVKKENKLTPEKLENALHAAIVVAYVQGLTLIQAAAAEQKWQIDLSEVITVWQGGCIIRAELLKDLVNWVKAPAGQHLLAVPGIQNALQNGQADWQALLIAGVENNVALGCYQATYQYLLGMVETQGSANLIQGLRDYFGAHTYERLDKEGVFHSQWQ